MAEKERLPDDAVVVRCGLPPFTARPLIEACGDHPDGVFGFSVQSAASLTVGQLATACRNKYVGYTTVREIRRLGYDVVRTGREFHHATVVVPRNWSTESADVLTELFIMAVNPLSQDTIMRRIYADFNAMTEADGVRLTTRGSQEDLQRLGIQPGDWTWLTDSELIVGARVSTDPYYGVIGVPDWDTLVHLDDEDDRDPTRIQAELRDLQERMTRSVDDELRIFQLLTLLEEFSVPEARSRYRPGYFSFRRAGTLLILSKPELALIEIEEARRVDPGRPNDDSLYLQILRRTDLGRATREAEKFAKGPDTSAIVLGECVNVLSTHADELPDDQFEPVGRLMLDWSDRFDQAPGRERVPASTLALLQFNRGMAHLRLGQVEAAREALRLARAVDPIFKEIDEATRLTGYDQQARDLAARARARSTAA